MLLKVHFMQKLMRSLKLLNIANPVPMCEATKSTVKAAADQV